MEIDKNSIDIKSINIESSNSELNKKENEQIIFYISNSYNKNRDIYLYGGYILLNNKKNRSKRIC